MIFQVTRCRRAVDTYLWVAAGPDALAEAVERAFEGDEVTS
jgi:hypothetical protein